MVTQPARLRGRAVRGGGGNNRKSVQASPVAALALERGIAPERIWAPETARDVRSSSASVSLNVLHLQKQLIRVCNGYGLV